MKKISLLSGLFISSVLLAQIEYTTYKNGLIYNEKTMAKLGKIVDSLNLKYKTCDLTKVFYSKLQTKGYIITLDSGNVAQAKNDIDHHISFEDFVKKYPNSKVKKDNLFIKSKRKDYRKLDIIEVQEIGLGDNRGFYLDEDYTAEKYNKPAKNTWMYRNNKGYNTSEESLLAFYFPDNFESHPLDLQYNRQIIYSDCLIDTASAKFKNTLKEPTIQLPKNWQKLSVKSKMNLLEKMRGHQAYGTCSQDESPRIQAINIALLSADVNNWEVFLKSHLDIMNDRFERVSDASYAQQQRQTYIKELEHLNINVQDLILGIAFRIENPVNNHYFGSIGRLGRAISESEHINLFLTKLLSMIKDEKLDDYNRVIAYFFYENCNSYIKDDHEKKINNTRLTEAIEKLPKYISEKILAEKN